MAIRLPYETKAGQFSEAESFLQLIEHLRLAAEGCYAIGHFRKANGDEFTGQGFLAIGQMLENNVGTVIKGLTKNRVIT